MRGRPLLFTTYASDAGLLPTMTKRVALVVLLVAAILAPFGRVPLLGFLGGAGWHLVLAQVLVFAIGALGLNILTGLAGQVSLGHAFFMGVGAYAGVVLGGARSDRLWGLGLPIWIWLPGAGLVAALIGVVVSPVAVRVRGLYLGIVTLGLVFLGDHLFRNLDFICGAPGIGREWPKLQLKVWKEGTPLLDLAHDGRWFGVDISATQKQIMFLIPLVVLAALATKNLTRTRVGRALQAIRDRDIAAEIMGVAEFRHKTIAFAISSFFAGVAGALLGSIIGSLNPEYWSLALSVEFIAILLIGGAGTVSGTLMGATFVVASTRLVEDFTHLLERTAAGHSLLHGLADAVVARGNDFGLISLQPTGPGLSVYQFNQLLYGLLIVLFLLFEPLGLYGIWGRARNFWRTWPFTY